MLRPSLIQPCVDQRGTNAFGSCPLSDCLRYAIKCDPSIISAVIGLRGFVRPAAICWRVSGGVINTVKRCVLWALPHVAHKGFKRLAPTVADGYVSTAVIGKVTMTGDAAASNHVFPAFSLTVHICSTKCVLASLARRLFLLDGQTSARCCFAALYLSGWCSFGTSARTAKKPNSLTRGAAASVRNGCEPPKNLSRNVVVPCHC